MGDLGVIIIDYLQLITGAKGENRARKSGQSTIVVGCPPVLYPKWAYFLVLL